MRVWTVENWLSLVSIVFVAIGGFFAWHQWRKSNKTKRAEFINKIVENLRFNEDIANTMYMVKYKTGWYNADFHDNPDGLEFSVDKLLSHFEYICYLRKTKNITTKEFSILKFDIDTVCKSPDVQKHLLDFLRDVSNSIETIHPYHYLIKYGEESGIFSKIKHI